jgi:hypothetical protein
MSEQTEPIQPDQTEPAKLKASENPPLVAPGMPVPEKEPLSIPHEEMFRGVKGSHLEGVNHENPPLVPPGVIPAPKKESVIEKIEDSIKRVFHVTLHAGKSRIE